MSRKKNIALLSVLSNTFLILIKVAAGILTGSVSIISEAIHSGMDLAAAVIAFISVRISDRPADDEHQYGHEKIENVSGVIEGLLIVIAAFWIIYEVVHKIMINEPVQSVGIGFIVMFISAGVNALVSRKLYKVAREEDSIALEADALHLKADVYTSLGVGGGLFLIWLTGKSFLDPVVAIAVALFILKEAFELTRNAFNPIMDSSLSKEEMDKLRLVIEKYRGEFIDYHDLRTRKSGKTRHIDFHITVNKDLLMQDVHALCDRMESDIENALRNTKILIHPETRNDDLLK